MSTLQISANNQLTYNQRREMQNDIATTQTIKTMWYMVKLPSVVFAYVPVAMGFSSLATFLNAIKPKENEHSHLWKVSKVVTFIANDALEAVVPFKVNK
ncbi:hypothetical protein [Parashewanella tropica]|uniref:hypothetical protein n=1 Tax=Parashewanella tropica TaxID=2547970 RepID=UPI00105A9762|nr:hypothetical protein [Parashewanella tropica]